MAVKLELYRVFQEVARMGNISAAAQNLFISQSAVSQSIKQLEEQLQVRLFSRSTRGVVLTSEGKLLLDYVSHGLGLIQCGEEKLAQSRQLLTGELIIGASDTVTKTYLVSRLEAFHQNYPAIQIRILNGTSQMVLDYLGTTTLAPFHGELIIAMSPEAFAKGRPGDPFARAEVLFEAIAGQGARLPSQRRFAARRQSEAEGITLSAEEMAGLEKRRANPFG